MFGKLQTSFLKPILPAFFFFAGVTYDSFTLTRIDRLLDNLILLLLGRTGSTGSPHWSISARPGPSSSCYHFLERPFPGASSSTAFGQRAPVFVGRTL